MKMAFPGSMKCGLAAGILGGLVSFFAMAYTFKPDMEDAIISMGLLLLIAVMFFAIAGGFSKTSQWTQNVLLGFCLLTIGVSAAVLLIGYVPQWFSAIEIVLAVLATACAYLGTTGHYLETLAAEKN